MLPVKLVRSLVLGEAMKNPFLDSDDDDAYDGDNDLHAHDADNEEGDDQTQKRTLREEKLKKKMNSYKNKNKRRLPLLLFTPTRELISDTFRLAAIARDIGMDFHPTSSLSHLIFSWPHSSPSPPSSSSSSSTPSTSSPFSHPSVTRPSVSSSSSSTSLWANDAVPLPFPSLSSPSTSLSLLRYFVTLSKGIFKLVFFNLDQESEIDPRVNIFGNWHYNFPGYYDDSDSFSNPNLFSRVSCSRVGSMDDFSRELAGHGWTLYRNRQKPKCNISSSSSSSSSSEMVYLFRKKELNRVRGYGRVGECRVRELRLPAVDFKNGVPLRILLYILLMTDDVFYLAQPMGERKG